ncbi:MAG TPA: hypothetical protein VLI04_10625 [Nocardioidaceae bacterium]|nr:hypothetical protein [Nocardioidaceae bacterium]
MVALHSLLHTVEETHKQLVARLDTAAAMVNTPGQPRKGYEHTDTFLAAASRHLNAVEEVLVPAVRKHVDEGSQLAHGYVRTSKHLEVALANAKAREYGSAYAIRRSWDDVWGEVRGELEMQARWEAEMVGQLSEELEVGELDDLATELHRAELAAPTRPHPYAPHLGVRGKVARRVLHAVDSFWDAAEGRMIPEPVRPPHKAPGLFVQYLLADPRFDEEESV